MNPPKESESGYEGFASIIESLDGVTGINLRAAQVLVAECGIDMERFATDKHVASWLGVCPNNQVSAGKRLRAKSGKGNRHARAIFVQAAQGVAKSKGTYLRALSERYKGRMGQTSSDGNRSSFSHYHLPYDQEAGSVSRRRARDGRRALPRDAQTTSTPAMNTLRL